MTKQEWVCFFKGHRADDEGYCDRCEKDYNYWIESLENHYYNVVYRIVWWFRDNIYWRCQECKKASKVFGKEVNDHSQCLPF